MVSKTKIKKGRYIFTGGWVCKRGRGPLDDTTIHKRKDNGVPYTLCLHWRVRKEQQQQEEKDEETFEEEKKRSLWFPLEVECQVLSFEFIWCHHLGL